METGATQGNSSEIGTVERPVSKGMKKIWEFDVIIARCLTCKGLIESRPTEPVEMAFLQHLKNVHNVDVSQREIVLRSSKV